MFYRPHIIIYSRTSAAAGGFGRHLHMPEVTSPLVRVPGQESITANVADLDKYWSEQDFKKNLQLKMAATFWTSFDVQNELPIPLLLHGDHASFSEQTACWW